MIKRFLFAALAVTTLSVSSARADFNFQFSTSDTDAAAGTDMTMTLGGDNGFLHLWVSTDAGQTMVGASHEILSSNADVVEGVVFNIDNPNDDRWASTEGGTPGDLFAGTQALALPPFAGDGLDTNGDFVLYASMEIAATALGTTEISMQEGGNGFGDLNGSAVADLSSTANISVVAIPEPGSLVILALAGMPLLARRRR